MRSLLRMPRPGRGLLLMLLLMRATDPLGHRSRALSPHHVSPCAPARVMPCGIHHALRGHLHRDAEVRRLRGVEHHYRHHAVRRRHHARGDELRRELARVGTAMLATFGGIGVWVLRRAGRARGPRVVWRGRGPRTRCRGIWEGFGVCRRVSRYIWDVCRLVRGDNRAGLVCGVGHGVRGMGGILGGFWRCRVAGLWGRLHVLRNVARLGPGAVLYSTHSYNRHVHMLATLTHSGMWLVDLLRR